MLGRLRFSMPSVHRPSVGAVRLLSRWSGGSASASKIVRSPLPQQQLTSPISASRVSDHMARTTTVGSTTATASLHRFLSTAGRGRGPRISSSPLTDRENDIRDGAALSEHAHTIEPAEEHGTLIWLHGLGEKKTKVRLLFEMIAPEVGWGDSLIWPHFTDWSLFLRRVIFCRICEL